MVLKFTFDLPLWFVLSESVLLLLVLVIVLFVWKMFRYFEDVRLIKEFLIKKKNIIFYENVFHKKK